MSDLKIRKLEAVPLKIEAVQLTEENLYDVAAWLGVDEITRGETLYSLEDYQEQMVDSQNSERGIKERFRRKNYVAFGSEDAESRPRVEDRFPMRVYIGDWVVRFPDTMHTEGYFSTVSDGWFEGRFVDILTPIKLATFDITPPYDH